MRIIYVFNAFVVLLYLIQTTEAQSGVDVTTSEQWTNLFLDDFVMRTTHPFNDLDIDLVYNEMPNMIARAYNGNKTIIPHLINQIAYLRKYRLEAKAFKELSSEMIKWKHNNNDEVIMLASFMYSFQRKIDTGIDWDNNNEDDFHITKDDLKWAIDHLPDIVRVFYFSKEFLIVPKLRSDIALQVSTDDSIGCMHKIGYGYEKWTKDERRFIDDFDVTFRFRNSRSRKYLNADEDEELLVTEDEPSTQQWWTLKAQDSTQWFILEHKNTSMFLVMKENIPCQVYCFAGFVEEERDNYLWKFQESK